MAVEVGIWRVDGGADKVRRVAYAPMPNEGDLEQIIATDLSILDPQLLVIGRQVLTAHGKFIDLLAMDIEGQLVVIELKRDKAPREVVAQALDYGSWVRTLQDDDIAAIFDAFQQKYRATSISLDDAFRQRFRVDRMPDELNAGHRLLIVASELDAATERIVAYLASEYEVPINVAFFRFFREGEAEYLSRAWLLDPAVVEATQPAKTKDPWNGECYVSFGGDSNRNWDAARRHGYISAGGGEFYVNTLRSLSEGERVWVNVPGTGYVGVGRVVEPAKPITEFEVRDADGVLRPVTEVVPDLPYRDVGPERQEHFVRVEWVKAVALQDAIKERGFFGNQNTVARPRTDKWAHTIERLKKRFDIRD